MGAIVVQYSQNSCFFFVRSASVAVVVAVLTLSGKGLRFRVRACGGHCGAVFSK